MRIMSIIAALILLGCEPAIKIETLAEHPIILARTINQLNELSFVGYDVLNTPLRNRINADDFTPSVITFYSKVSGPIRVGDLIEFQESIFVVKHIDVELFYENKPNYVEITCWNTDNKKKHMDIAKLRHPEAYYTADLEQKLFTPSGN